MGRMDRTDAARIELQSTPVLPMKFLMAIWIVYFFWSDKSLAWSSVLLVYHNIGKIGEVVDRPKALGDIRGVSYIYGMFYRFGLIDVPEKVKEKMTK